MWCFAKILASSAALVCQVDRVLVIQINYVSDDAIVGVID
jgi:hypothetical protein